MSKAFFFLAVALIVLGFLVSHTMNMYGDLEQLRAENRRLSTELEQLRSEHESAVAERDALKQANTQFGAQVDELQQAYAKSEDGRQRAESESTICKNLLVGMSQNAPVVAPDQQRPSETQAADPEQMLQSSLAPIGAFTVGALAMAVIWLAAIRLYRKHNSPRHWITTPRNNS